MRPALTREFSAVQISVTGRNSLSNHVAVCPLTPPLTRSCTVRLTLHAPETTSLSRKVKDMMFLQFPLNFNLLRVFSTFPIKCSHLSHLFEDKSTCTLVMYYVHEVYLEFTWQWVATNTDLHVGSSLRCKGRFSLHLAAITLFLCIFHYFSMFFFPLLSRTCSLMTSTCEREVRNLRRFVTTDPRHWLTRKQQDECNAVLWWRRAFS